MFFDTEQWPVHAGEGPGLLLGVVDNRVLVCPRVGKKYKVCIRVPSGFFSFMNDALKLQPEAVKSHPVKFYLEEEHDRSWCLIMGTLAMPSALALWSYRSLPAWAQRTRCLP